MSLRRYNPKRDEAEKGIVDALEQAGFHVWRMNVPADLLVWKYGQPFRVLEVKSPGSRRDKRQEAQTEFLRVTGAPIVKTPEEALKAVGAMR